MKKKTFKQFLIENDAYDKFVNNYKDTRRRLGFRNNTVPLLEIMSSRTPNQKHHIMESSSFWWQDSPEGLDYWHELICGKWDVKF